MGFGLEPAVRGADVLLVWRFVECGSCYDPHMLAAMTKWSPRFSNSMRDAGMKQAVLQRVDQLQAALRHGKPAGSSTSPNARATRTG
jgi:hypothetical protein